MLARLVLFRDVWLRWRCLVRKSPTDRHCKFIFVQLGRFFGPAIEISHRFGDTSGRSDVAEVIALSSRPISRLSMSVMEGLTCRQVPVCPYPKDILTYKGEKMVEFTTPAETEGLGTD